MKITKIAFTLCMLGLFVIAIFAEDATEEHKNAMKSFQKSVMALKKGEDVPGSIAAIKATAKTVEAFWVKRDPETTKTAITAINEGTAAAEKAGTDAAAVGAAATQIMGACRGCHGLHKGPDNTIK